MIQIAIIFQVAAVIFAIAHFSAQKTEPIEPGQVYERLYRGYGNGRSSIFYQTVLEVKDGYVKYNLQGVAPADSGEHVETIEKFLDRARLIKPETNPFTP